MSKSRRSRRRKGKLLAEATLADLPPLPPDATEFDQICHGAVERFLRLQDSLRIDWSQCPDAERTPGKLSGAWCVKGHRIRCQDILDNADAGASPEEIAREIYDLDVETVRRILAFAAQSS
jgi:uncharacterized protein (DUF433 family)